MNLLLHGLEYPNIDGGNSLRVPLKDIGDNDRVDIIITNPPFGGEEEKGILNNFPEDKKTAETTLLFLQLIMRKLKRKVVAGKGGRAAIVLPNGALFADGIAARIKKQLVDDFNVHTIVRLGDGVFAPYTDIPSNLIFFEEGKRTKEIWYYEILPPDERKRYSKTKSIQSGEFEELKKWWNNRVENENAWKVKVDSLIKTNEKDICYDHNLDIKNPNRKNELEYNDPDILVESILEKEKSVLQILKEIKSTIQEKVEHEL
jgi:type I restriction enzyme M protein